MKLADYVYKIHDHHIFIKDLNQGNISLTNSLEHVLKVIDKKEDIQGLTIVEIDSEEEISEVLWEGGDEVAWCAFDAKEEARLKDIINQLFN